MQPPVTNQHKIAPPVSATVGVVEIVASIKGVRESDLQPLAEAVDTDFLDWLFEGTETTESPYAVVFSYSGYEITVRSDRTLTLRPK
ncbi:hypothetical protein HUB97_06890 [Halorubraceae archaeon YAN]|nr:hypothetical protein [Halorubraceae archaeon YAN]